MSESDDESSRCYKCGKEANETCSSCKDAFYCSRACQRWDWKTGGHKALCRGPPLERKIHRVLRELFAAEWQWLQGPCDFWDMPLYHDDCERDPNLNHQFSSGGVAMVLARANPCALLSHPAYPLFGLEYYTKILSPWYNKHQEFLNEQGFQVDFISHGIHLSDCPCDCMIDGAPCGNPQDFAMGGVALLKDLRSPKIELINKVFTTERSKAVDTWKEEESVAARDMIECLSFPLNPESEGVELGRDVCFYLFEFPNQVLGGDVDDHCCTYCFKMRHIVDPKDSTSLGVHLRKAREAMRKIGFNIGMDVVEQEEWPDEALAELWMAVAGNDIDLLESWLLNPDDDSLPFSVRVEDRVEEIFAIAYEMSD